MTISLVDDSPRRCSRARCGASTETAGEITAEFDLRLRQQNNARESVERPTADPLADLRGAMRLVANQCGASADLVVMGRSAADAFESNPNVLNAFDKQRINQGVLSASNLSWGVISLGSYRGVTLHVYEADISGGAMKPFVPVYCVLIASSAAAGCFSYAGISQVDQDERTIRVYEGPRIPMISYENFEDIRKFRLSSRPVPVPQNLSAWTILDVL